MKSTPITVVVESEAKRRFFKRHRKDSQRADEVWVSLVEKRPELERDGGAGQAIARDRWPAGFRELPNLFRLGVAHGFRALYSVVYDQEIGHQVRIVWIGSHPAYDRLFGYATS